MTTSAIAYRLPARIAAAVLVAVSRGGALALLALFVFVPSFHLANQLRLMRAFVAVVLLPGFAAWLWERASAVTATIADGTLVLRRGERRSEVPCAAIDRVVPWRIPLPASGVSLGLGSGRGFAYRLQLADPVVFIDALADAGAFPRVRDAARRPAAIYARAKHETQRSRYHAVLGFPLFALVPATLIFRLHQWIAYGGMFGEYYTYGLRAYLLGFGVYWATATVLLVLYAALLRTIAELIAMPATWLAPARAVAVRHAVERADRVLYYGAVAALLLRFYLLSH